MPEKKIVMSNLQKPTGTIKYDNPLGISWQDNGFIPHLNPSNVLTYFAGSPFYDKQCNNEILAMQGRPVTPENLGKMPGIEYILLHCQEPILYVIRKQQRHGPSNNLVSPLANYYIVAGVVYQAPDLFSVINSRLLSCTIHLQKSLNETLAASKYAPDKGYHWDFGESSSSASSSEKGSTSSQSEDALSSTAFQRQFVDLHLAELARKHFQRVGSGGGGGNLSKSPAGGAAAAGAGAGQGATAVQSSASATSALAPSSAQQAAATTAGTTSATNVAATHILPAPVKIEQSDDASSSINRGPPDKKPRLTY